MENLIIAGTKDNYYTPSVNFDAKTGVCSIAGESFLEDTIAFYHRLIRWLEEYMNTVGGPIDFNIKLVYFNTSSSRSILDLLLLLKRYKDKGKDVEVKWYYDINNKLGMQEEVEDFSDDADIEIELLPLEQD